MKTSDETNTLYTFESLTPYADSDLGIYESALDYVFKHPEIKNVALSGSYGAGKSSVLASYEKKQGKEKNYLHISLAHFTDESEAMSNDQVKESVLEGKILNQLIHQISPSKIPQTNFRVKEATPKKSIIQSFTSTEKTDGDPADVAVDSVSNIRNRIRIPIAPHKAKAILIAERIQKAVDRGREFLCLKLRFHIDSRRDALRQLIQNKVVLTVALTCGIAAVLHRRKIAGNVHTAVLNSSCCGAERQSGGANGRIKIEAFS